MTKSDDAQELSDAEIVEHLIGRLDHISIQDLQFDPGLTKQTLRQLLRRHCKPDLPEDAVGAARECAAITMVSLTSICREYGIAEKNADRAESKFVEAFTAIIRRVCKPDLPELPWPGPFEPATDIHGNYWVSTGGNYILSVVSNSLSETQQLCCLLTAAWDAQQKGSDDGPQK